MDTSGKLKAVLCDAKNVVCIEGSDEDKEILQSAIVEVEKLEKYTNILREITKIDNKVIINIEQSPKEMQDKIVWTFKNIFKDYPDEIKEMEL